MIFKNSKDTSNYRLSHVGYKTYVEYNIIGNIWYRIKYNFIAKELRPNYVLTASIVMGSIMLVSHILMWYSVVFMLMYYLSYFLFLSYMTVFAISFAQGYIKTGGDISIEQAVAIINTLVDGKKLQKNEDKNEDDEFIITDEYE